MAWDSEGLDCAAEGAWFVDAFAELRAWVAAAPTDGTIVEVTLTASLIWKEQVAITFGQNVEMRGLVSAGLRRRRRRPVPPGRPQDAPQDAALVVSTRSRAAVRIDLLRASTLVASDLNGLSDPYCVLRLKGAQRRSRVIPKTLDPE